MVEKTFWATFCLLRTAAFTPVRFPFHSLFTLPGLRFGFYCLIGRFVLHLPPTWRAVLGYSSVGWFHHKRCALVPGSLAGSLPPLPLPVPYHHTPTLTYPHPSQRAYYPPFSALLSTYPIPLTSHYPHTTHRTGFPFSAYLPAWRVPHHGSPPLLYSCFCLHTSQTYWRFPTFPFHQPRAGGRREAGGSPSPPKFVCSSHC